ncbi:MAG: hypothetical protein ACIARR_03915 [Phycisphaerales bacterium JB059]
MAARTGASVGVAVTITILGVLSLGLFVLSMVFYGNAARAQQELAQVQNEAEDFIKPSEREREGVRRALTQAGDERKSVVDYLLTQLRESMTLAAGPDSADLTASGLREQIISLGGSDGDSLAGMVRDREATINDLQTRLAQAEADRQDALDRAAAESARVAAIESEFNVASEAMGDDVGTMRGDLQSVWQRVADLESEMNNRVSRIQNDADSEQTRLRSTIAEQRSEIQVLKTQVARLRGEGGTDRIQPLAEESLVDADVRRVDPVAREVILSIGRGQKVILGMTFAIYADSTEIRPDPITGVYPRGKATVEVIRVNDGFSVARIIEESRGNPIVKGDVAANAVYDPNKTYKLMVFGNFDINGDGVATPLEGEDLKALIRRWGGELTTQITGDVDFVVLGEKPVLGPEPPTGSPVEVVEEYLRRKRMIERYDQLFERAQTTAIPVLNENRLRTLIGDFPS